jgi:hypothetical protein
MRHHIGSGVSFGHWMGGGGGRPVIHRLCRRSDGSTGDCSRGFVPRAVFGGLGDDRAPLRTPSVHIPWSGVTQSLRSGDRCAALDPSRCFVRTPHLGLNSDSIALAL